jgi:hypothetical protein
MDRYLVVLCCVAVCCVLTLTGCASIVRSVAENAVDSISCRNECPAGPLRKECLETCRRRLNDVRKANEGKNDDRQVWPEPGSAYESPQLPAALDPVRQLGQRKK